MTSRMLKIRRGLGRLLLALVLVAVAPLAAQAHAILLSSDPPDFAVLPVSPERITLRFNEPVLVTSIRLIGFDGSAVETTEGFGPSEEITWPVPAPLTDGGWLVSWQVISIDSHPIAGTFRFAVGAGAATFAEVPDDASLPSGWPRAIMLAGTLFCAGLLLASAVLVRSRPRRLSIAVAGGLVVAAAGAVWFLLDTAATAGGGSVALRAAFDILGPGSITTVAALAVATILSFLGRPWLAAAAGLVALIGLGLSGHVAGAPPSWLARPAHLIHAAVAALWFGSLIVLLVRRQAAAVDGSPALLGRFSRVGPFIVAGLIVTGATLLLIQAGSVTALVESRYGFWLLIKVVLVAVLLAIAAWNRWRLTRPALAGSPGAERALRISIAAELGLFAGIAIATAMLGTAVPPRSIAAAAAPPCPVPGTLERSGTDIGLTVTMKVSSACAGSNDLMMTFSEADGTVVMPTEVMLRFSLPDMGVEPFDIFLDPAGSGYAGRYELPLPGEWLAQARIVLGEYTLRRVVLRLPLAAR